MVKHKNTIKNTVASILISTISLLLILIILVSCSSSKSGSEEGGESSQKPQSSQKSTSKGSQQGGGGSEDEGQGEPHEYIEDAKSVKIEPIEAAQLDINHVVFLDPGRISITCPKDIGEHRSFLYDLETKQAVKLPDNTTVLKKLDNDDLFVMTKANTEYAILDGASYTVKKAIARPENVDNSLDISPDGKSIAYVTDEGLFISDLDFQNPVRLLAAKREGSAFDMEMPRYPKWFDANRIGYKMMGFEGVLFCGVTLRDASDNKTYTEAQDSTLYPLVSGDYLFRNDSGKGAGLIDANTGQKKFITQSLIEKEGFSYDKNGKWVSYYLINKDVTDENKWTGRFEVKGISTESKIVEFETEKPNAKPIEDAVASPDGKFLLFTDMDKSGRRVLYKLEISVEQTQQK
ncbi:MAG: hypothetical protein ACOX1Q_00930 [Eubacteriales bacterium]